MSTFNVGTINTDKKMAWSARAKPFAAVVDTMDLHLIAFQEAMEFENDFRRYLSPAVADDWLITSDYVNCPTMARADLFEPVKHNGKLSINIKMRTVPHVRWRYGSACLLREKATDLTFVFASLHLSNNGESSHAATDRVWQAKDAWSALENWGVTQFPMLLFGDFNDKGFAPSGPAGVFAEKGLGDALAQIKASARIDRGFVKGFRTTGMKVFPMSNSLSDHDPVRYTVETVDATAPNPAPGDGATTPAPKPKPKPTPKPETELERLNRIHGKITKFRISSFEKARKDGYPSRYTAVVQDWLDRPVTTKWSKADQAALDAWRKKEFPHWLEWEYTGAVGPSSMARLAAVAKKKGKKVYKVVQ